MGLTNRIVVTALLGALLGFFPSKVPAAASFPNVGAGVYIIMFVNGYIWFSLFSLLPFVPVLFKGSIDDRCKDVGWRAFPLSYFRPEGLLATVSFLSI
jgi:hypothetical protein